MLGDCISERRIGLEMNPGQMTFYVFSARNVKNYVLTNSKIDSIHSDCLLTSFKFPLYTFIHHNEFIKKT